MVSLPTKWKDPSNNKTYDLTDKDMVVGANIMAWHDQGLCMLLNPSEEAWRSGNPIPEKKQQRRYLKESEVSMEIRFFAPGTFVTSINRYFHV